MILDIGPKTVKLFEEKLKNARTVFWNGPLGFNEVKPFAKGSRAIAEAVGRSNAVSVVGGGDIVSFLHEYGLDKLFTHVSTGGGASLEFVAGEKLPGVEALQKK
jgi:phosphoglycerate kinase